ncbi:MAG: GFA family protein [Paracoccus sp. (in: a-proteobacteria)]|nr:GFA family protein [Paracoccus sp. (in: a-proteobacteria)]
MLTGGCQCGALRYRVGADPVRVYVCHCTECRAQSSSAFGISVIVPPAAVILEKGQPRIWQRDTASGKVLACAFCGDCGSRVWHVNEPAGAEMSIKGGSLDQPVDLSAAMHIWTISALPGVVIPDGAVQWERDHD